MPEQLQPIPSMPKTLRRAIHKHKYNGLAEASAYLAQCFKSAEDLRKFLPGATLPDQVLIKAAQEIIRDRKIRKVQRIEDDAIAAVRNENERNEAARIHDQAVTETLAALIELQPRIRYIASLSTEDRVRFANKQEQLACVDLRKACVTTFNARTLISATQTEFDRWVEEGLITYVFTKRISVGKMVAARYWSTEELVAFQDQVEPLRELWAKRKKARRTKLKLVVRA